MTRRGVHDVRRFDINRRMLRPAATALILAIVWMCGALPSAAAPTAHVLRFAAAEELATLNPEINSQLVLTYLTQMTGAFAFRLDRANRLMPELATVIPTVANGGIAKDGRTVTLHLRSGVRWSDGVAFGADDVAFTIGVFNNPANLVIERGGFDQIVKVEVPNATTVVVHLKVPFGAIVPTLFSSGRNYPILPKHLLGNLPNINNAAFNGLPVGIGPFRYKAWRRGEAIELERNPFYWRGQPALESVVMKLIPDRNTVLTQLQTGELDLWYPFGGTYLSRVAAISGVHIIRHPAISINQMLFNVSGPVLSDRSVREALRYAVNRPFVRNTVAHGVGIVQNVILPIADPATPKDIALTPFSPAKANAILDAAGWKRGPDGIRSKHGVRLAVQFVTSTGTPDADTQIELIRSWWHDVGAELNVQRFNSPMLFGPYAQGGILSNGKFDVMFLGLVLPAPVDLMSAYGCHEFPPQGQNYAHYCNPKLDAIVSAYSRSFNQTTRDKLLSQAVHLIDDEALVTVMVGREDLFAVNNAVRNFNPNAATPFDDMLRVDVLP